MLNNSYFSFLTKEKMRAHYLKLAHIVFMIISFLFIFSLEGNGPNIIEKDQVALLSEEKHEILSLISGNKTKNCPLCKVNSDIGGGDSTTKDFAVCFAFRRVYSIVPFIRTFRSISNATFVFILDKEAWTTLPKKIINLVSSCGGMIIHLDYRVTYSFFDDKTLYRSKIHAYAQFLELYHEYIDRVLLFDLEDSIFQADPFRIDLYDTRNKINLFMENLIIKDSPSNNRDIKKLKLPNWKEVKHKKVINGATSIGPASMMLNWIKTIDHELHNEHFGRYDQSLFNAYGYTYGYNNLSLHYGKIITLRKADILDPMTIGKIRCISDPEINPLIIIHHSTFQKKLLKKYYEHCPRGEYNVNGYIHKLPKQEMEDLDKILATQQ